VLFYFSRFSLIRLVVVLA